MWFMNRNIGFNSISFVCLRATVLFGYASFLSYEGLCSPHTIPAARSLFSDQPIGKGIHSLANQIEMGCEHLQKLIIM